MKKIIFLLLFIISSLFADHSHLKKVSLQLMWLDQFEFAGFYLAKEKGYYENLGLDVEFKKFSFDTDITKMVENGDATFGLSSSSLIIDMANGSQIQLLGAVFQSSPLALLSLKESNIKQIEDIKNKKVMLSSNQEFFATIQSLLTSKNIKTSDINIVPHTFKVDDLISKKVDMMSVYTTNEPFVLKEKGYEGNIFYPRDFGFDFYDDILFTSKKFALVNPNIVQDFIDASIKGWQYAINNIEESVQFIYENYNPQNKSLKALRFEALEMRKLIFSQKGTIGDIDLEKLRLIEHSYKIMGLLKKDLDLEQMVFKREAKNGLKFNGMEHNYLANKKEITMCIDPDWMPFEKK